MTLPPFLRVQPDGVLLSIKLQPRASVASVGEALGSELRVKVTAPPVEGAANEALVKLLAVHFDCARSRIQLIRGHASTHKVVKFHRISAEEILTVLGKKSR